MYSRCCRAAEHNVWVGDRGGHDCHLVVFPTFAEAADLVARLRGAGHTAEVRTSVRCDGVCRSTLVASVRTVRESLAELFLLRPAAWCETE